MALPPAQPILKKREPWQDPQAKPYIVLENISKNFGTTFSLKNINLSLHKGEFFSILGASGCGKTTLLRLLAGLEQPTSGKIYIDGVDITHVPPYERPVNMMFQSYALFPHMTVYQNVAYGLKQEGIAKKTIDDRVRSVLNLVQMNSFIDRRPHQLSGGQCQRVALARSLVKQPKLLLLDEPLGALDRQLREQTQFELVNIQERVGITFIIVTHDQEEAMTMSSRMAVMDEGTIRQVGIPHDIYEFPNSRFIAEFIGSANILEGIVLEDQADHLLIESESAKCQLHISHSASAPVGSTVAVALRPEKVMLSRTPPVPGRYNCTKGIVREIGYLGDISIYHIELGSGKIIRASLPNLLRLSERDLKWDDEVYAFWRTENGVVLTA